MPGESLINPDVYSYTARFEMVDEAVRRLRAVHLDGMADVILKSTALKPRLRYNTKELMEALLALPMPPIVRAVDDSGDLVRVWLLRLRA